MSNSRGFGNQPFGHRPFGHEDWAFSVLYEDLPEKHKEKDAENDYLYKKFVQAVAKPFNELKVLLDNFGNLYDPDKIRRDLLYELAEAFGVDIDENEPFPYQRTAVRVCARFFKIKGQHTAFKVLANVYGFDLTVQELWWDGSAYTVTPAQVTGELILTVV